MSDYRIEMASLFNKPEYDRAYRQAHPNKEREAVRRKRKGGSLSDVVYLGRKFVAIDGEGINIPDERYGEVQVYNLLKVAGNPSLVDHSGLSTKAILDYLWKCLESGPNTINVVYGASYDWNMWVRDLPEYALRALYTAGGRGKKVVYEGYGLKWIKGKEFHISRPLPKSRKQKRVKWENKVIYDVIPFFQRSFISACEEYLGKEFPHRSIIVEQKARRGRFTADELGIVETYNQFELDLLEQLMEELRARLHKVGLRPGAWNGPGAIAGSLFRREGVKSHFTQALPDGVKEASRYAYAGGRFELIRYGSVLDRRSYEYDINSAYPAALREVPSLTSGGWVHRTGASASARHPFALYRVRFVLPDGGDNARIPGPIFIRSRTGTISYPTNGENWIWSPERDNLDAYAERVPGFTYEVLERWSFEATSDVKPFGFVQGLYDERQVLKAAKDGAHVGIKLGLNSMYGKCAQQVGAWQDKDGEWHLPSYHQLEVAGFVTSWCRAKVLRVLLDNDALDDVIAFETDAVFTSRALDVEDSTELGGWERSVFTSLTYVQSGHYYGTQLDEKTGDETEVVKCRGINKEFVSRAAVETALQNPPELRVLNAENTLFYGAGIALMSQMDKWCRWITEPKVLQLYPPAGSKRMHIGCDCVDTEGLEVNRWHTTMCPVQGSPSRQYPVVWANPDPDMVELEELRNSENVWDEVA